ncbi:ribonuclease inhibitor [Longimicrobium terrae]|nr:barstar family protein [Longimicrobium terrae]NNC31783.1 ribonuclease inhibitor [Longimicrobium terrae]
MTIAGGSITGIPSFYAEINRVFMADEDWALGESLDALNDLLSGGFGAIAGREAVTVVWRDMDASRSALGVETTTAFLRAKLERPHVFNVELIGRQLDELERGVGNTYFETVIEIIADHPNIRLVAA